MAKKKTKSDQKLNQKIEKKDIWQMKLNRYKQNLVNTYRQKDNIFVKGKGMYLYDIKGNRYLDFVAGIAVNGLGYSNKKLKKALTKQVEQLLHVSNLYYNEPCLVASEKLIQATKMDKVFFANSGTEAVEAALKLARKYQTYKGQAHKTDIITMKNSFHGRTYGAITATGQTKYQAGLGPLLPGIKYAEFNDLDSVLNLCDDNTGAIMLEVIQGEGGIKVVQPEFIQGIRKLCDDKGMVMIIDEVQTGIGRTGKVLASMHYGVKPDITALAKGLGSGIAVGAIVCTEEVAKGFQPGDHASTFGGNPLAMTAVTAVLDQVLTSECLEHINEMGDYLRKQLIQLMDQFEVITEVKGIGLMQGIGLSYPPAELVARAYEKGILLVGAGTDTVRFVPPFVVTKKEIDRLIKGLKKIL